MRPPPRGEHARGYGSRDQEVAGEVGVDDRSEAVRADPVERLRVGEEVRVHRPHADPGVVDQQVDAPEALLRFGDSALDRLLVGDVEDDPERSGRGCGRLGPLASPSGQRRSSSRSHERLHHRPPEATGAAGDESSGTGQIRRHVRRLPGWVASAANVAAGLASGRDAFSVAIDPVLRSQQPLSSRSLVLVSRGSGPSPAASLIGGEARSAPSVSRGSDCFACPSSTTYIAVSTRAPPNSGAPAERLAAEQAPRTWRPRPAPSSS